jgi:hypothetical protein
MPIRPSSTHLAADRDLNSTEDLPLSLLLFRYLWPFWLFKDASRGDRMTRAAAYRHNRGMRVYLPGYLLKWVISCAFALLMIFGFDSLSDRRGPDVFILMAAAMGIVFACGVCVLLMTGYVYLYLSSQDY